MRYRTRAALAAIAVLAVVPASAHALADAKVKPDTVYADDYIKVTFKSPRTVKKGFHLEYAVLAGSEGSPLECTSFKVVQTKKRPEKGQKVRQYIQPYDKDFGTTRWCVGKSSVLVNYVRDSDNKGGKMIASGDFRVFRP